MRLRKRVAFERFLARLAIVDPQRWVLKGAFALDLRLGLRTRTTKDIDLAGADDEQIATANLIAAQAIDLHDHFSFDVTRTPALDRAEAFRAVRYSATAELAGRRFEQFPVDVALSEHPTAPSERLPIPSLLDFADILPIEMPVIALEQHIAEKVHAYTTATAEHKDQGPDRPPADRRPRHPARGGPARKPRRDIPQPRPPTPPLRAPRTPASMDDPLHPRRRSSRPPHRPRHRVCRSRDLPRPGARRHLDRPLESQTAALDYFLKPMLSAVRE